MSVLADQVLPPAGRLPMQWNSDGIPNWYAPRWAALGAVPMLATAVFAIDAAVGRPRRNPGSALRSAVIGAAIMIAGDGLYLWLLWRYLRQGGA